MGDQRWPMSSPQRRGQLSSCRNNRRGCRKSRNIDTQIGHSDTDQAHAQETFLSKPVCPQAGRPQNQQPRRGSATPPPHRQVGPLEFRARFVRLGAAQAAIARPGARVGHRGEFGQRRQGDTRRQCNRKEVMFFLIGCLTCLSLCTYILEVIFDVSFFMIRYMTVRLMFEETILTRLLQGLNF